jgi:5-formyltetrahydrofolate cyclo-ligase
LTKQPHQPHDFTVDYIVTPERLIPCRTKQRPTGVDWQALTPELLDSVPVLQALAAQRLSMNGLAGVLNS